jgi:hypothetical protein
MKNVPLLLPSPVPAMSVKKPRAAEALVANAGPLLRIAIGPLMPGEMIRNEYQPIPKTRYQTHVAATPVPGSNTGIHPTNQGILKEKKDRFTEKGNWGGTSIP